MKRIHDSLQNVVARYRFVFWYDAGAEWGKEFDSFETDSAEKLRVENNEFGTKVRILIESDQTRHFLLYFHSAKPKETDNWLLDLLLQGHEYKADRSSLALQEAGLSYDFHHVVEEHIAFFNAPKRIDALRGLLDKDDDAAALRLKMMSVLAGTVPQLDSLLLFFLGQAAREPMMDAVFTCLSNAKLVDEFWRQVSRRFGYHSSDPSLMDFAVTLFRGANPLESAATQNLNARVLLEHWKQIQQHAPSFKEWSTRLEAEMHVVSHLDGLTDIEKILDADGFQAFERKIIHSLCQAFAAGASKDAIVPALNRRRGSFWYPLHEHGYKALENAVELRELIAGAELNVDSLATGFARYTQTWWRIDQVYRRFCTHIRRYPQTGLMERIVTWAEKAYVNNFLLPLTDRWSDCVLSSMTWAGAGLTSHTDFFDRYVRPFIDKGQKVFVVISDGLRYEAAQEFAVRLRNEDRWTCDVEAVLGSLPSYTQLGMAALLPGQVREIEPDTGTVLLDGRSTAGIENRAEILRTAMSGRATALQAEHFLELNTKTDGRALMRDHDVVYIYQNVIDATGDSPKTEAKTVDAVERALDELLVIIKKVANINATNMILTADHGFLFQQDDVADEDMVTLPPANEWSFRSRRFALGKGVQAAPRVKLFESTELGLAGSFTAAFSLSLGRFPQKGSGKRYVHGGTALQEVVIPVLSIHKARSSDTTRVEVDVLRLPSKITTGQASFALYQEQPVSEKTLPRSLRIGLYAKSGAPLSETRSDTFNSTADDARLREFTVVLTLSSAADAYNNQEIELRLDETLPGTSQTVLYKSFNVKLQKPFASDFDDF